MPAMTPPPDLADDVQEAIYYYHHDVHEGVHSCRAEHFSMDKDEKAEMRVHFETRREKKSAVAHNPGVPGCWGWIGEKAKR